jgi:hypothetical protein
MHPHNDLEEEPVSQNHEYAENNLQNQKRSKDNQSTQTKKCLGFNCYLYTHTLVLERKKNQSIQNNMPVDLSWLFTCLYYFGKKKRSMQNKMSMELLVIYKRIYTFWKEKPKHGKYHGCENITVI